MEPRVKTHIWVAAYIRRTMADGFSAVLATRGDADAGAVMLKINRFEVGCQVYTQVRDGNGHLAWMAGTGTVPVTESEADAYVERQRSYDIDSWVVEVEDPRNTYTLDGIVLED